MIAVKIVWIIVNNTFLLRTFAFLCGLDTIWIGLMKMMSDIIINFLFVYAMNTFITFMLFVASHDSKNIRLYENIIAFWSKRGAHTVTTIL